MQIASASTRSDGLTDMFFKKRFPEVKEEELLLEEEEKRVKSRKDEAASQKTSAASARANFTEALRAELQVDADDPACRNTVKIQSKGEQIAHSAVSGMGDLGTAADDAYGPLCRKAFYQQSIPNLTDGDLGSSASENMDYWAGR